MRRARRAARPALTGAARRPSGFPRKCRRGRAATGNGGWRLSKPPGCAHLQSGGKKTRGKRSNCVGRKKFPRALRADLLPRERKKNQPRPHPTGIRGSPPTRTNPAQLHQPGSCRAGARLQETLPSAPPAPAPPLPPPEAPRVTSACGQAGPGEHADTDSIETKSNQSI